MKLPISIIAQRSQYAWTYLEVDDRNDASLRTRVHQIHEFIDLYSAGEGIVIDMSFALQFESCYSSAESLSW